MMNLRIAAAFCTLFVVVLAIAACNASSRSSSSDSTTSRVGFSLEASRDELLVGETTTIFARSSDTFGRDPRITWTTSAGELVTEQGGRVARLTHDRPGTCVVTAVLTADGREIRRESIEIRVLPLS